MDIIDANNSKEYQHIIHTDDTIVSITSTRPIDTIDKGLLPEDRTWRTPEEILSDLLGEIKYSKRWSKEPAKEVTIQTTICPVCKTILLEWGAVIQPRSPARILVRCQHCKNIFEVYPWVGAEPRLIKRHTETITLEEE